MNDVRRVWLYCSDIMVLPMMPKSRTTVGPKIWLSYQLPHHHAEMLLSLSRDYPPIEGIRSMSLPRKATKLYGLG